VFWNNATTDGVLGWNGVNNAYLAYNISFYNNTIVGGWGNQGVNLPQSSSGQVTDNNVAKNNIWYNAGSFTFESINHDYNATSASSAISGESHSQANLPSSIFVSYSTGNFQLTVDTASGLSLSAPYNSDFSGNIRGASGIWDLGAYQFVGAVVLSPPTGLHVIDL
jgi:hypothetical protein